MSKYGFFYKGPNDFVTCFYCGLNLGHWKRGDQPSLKHNKFMPKHLLSITMKMETHRLKSFDKWPLTYVKPKDLAKNGFYYLYFKDLVQCAFCNLKLNDWKEGDCIKNRHPHCKLSLKNPKCYKKILKNAQCIICLSKDINTTL